jgi:L,D-transpeptidase YbiS
VHADAGPSIVHLCLATQTLTLLDERGGELSYHISSARNGSGCLAGSYCTPLGRHVIRLKIGTGCAPGTVFVRRRPTGEVYRPDLEARSPGRDWILSRILWLQGKEPGRNRGGAVDTLRRFIYIHGTADELAIGTPCSHGCIRMANADVIDLFDRVERGTPVHIHERWQRPGEGAP